MMECSKSLRINYRALLAFQTGGNNNRRLMRQEVHHADYTSMRDPELQFSCIFPVALVDRAGESTD